ncbi:hypothetical protein LAD80_000708 [Proteus mirabilis]|uniref:hypothetical protein n=1 Tax=Proteus mirabilis TaxID=584 RepID=UPI001B38B083|nr:hypothetical protein [Proteus mirabilis]EKV1609705.1 hypothetical protein [Proteus mirabilis]MBQ0616555.1 hypothetical protein [Proteus mirabilis]MCJ2218543.1 hypothetical protein [Proteus mirabilis]HCU2505184.1 hypothetical protein [Proteus mirabilis]
MSINEAKQLLLEMAINKNPRHVDLASSYVADLEIDPGLIVDAIEELEAEYKIIVIDTLSGGIPSCYRLR